jgi:hypothetical protein
MRFFSDIRPPGRWLEALLATAVVAGLLWAMIFLARNGFLPHPFFYEPSDTFMDWYNPTYWAYDKGRYDSWGSVYPPLSFAVLRAFSFSACYQGAEGVASRECDWLGIIVIHAIFVVNAILIARTFLKIDPKTALPRSIALSVGLPMVFALERGNLLLLTFTCVLLGYGPLLKSARLRWLAVALAINFKFYLVASLFPQLLKRRWRWFEGAAITTIFVYIVSYIIIGNGSPLDILRNITSVNDAYEAGGFLDGWYASTYKPFLSVLEGKYVPVNSIIGSANVDLLTVSLPIIQFITQVTMILAVALAWLRPEAISMFRLTNLGISLAAVTSEIGGYVHALVILFTFMERWKGIGLKWAIVACYVLCIPADIVIDRLVPVFRESYLGGRPVIFDFALTLGPFIRPLIMLSIAFALACVTIKEAWGDIHAQNWKFRWRYRRDAPIMVGDGTIFPPSSDQQQNQTNLFTR